MRYKRNAQKHQQELNNESLDKTKKVKKNKTIGGKQPNKVEK